MHGAIESICLQPLRCNVVAQFRTLAKSEECFVTTLLGTGFCNVEHLLCREERVFESCWGLSKSAIATGVAAQHGEGNKHLG